MCRESGIRSHRARCCCHGDLLEFVLLFTRTKKNRRGSETFTFRCLVPAEFYSCLLFPPFCFSNFDFFRCCKRLFVLICQSFFPCLWTRLLRVAEREGWREGYIIEADSMSLCGKFPDEKHRALSSVFGRFVCGQTDKQLRLAWA
jgi:hypothetical protein